MRSEFILSIFSCWCEITLSRFSIPQNSSLERASTICNRFPRSESRTCCIVASRFARGIALKATGDAGSGVAWVVGSPDDIQPFQPPFNNRTSSTPQYLKIHQMRAASFIPLSSKTTTFESGPIPSAPIRLPQPSLSFPPPQAPFQESWSTRRAPDTCPWSYFSSVRTSSSQPRQFL